MNKEGYQRYLEETAKREIYRRLAILKYLMKAQQKLDDLTSKPWLWMVIPNNCASFVEEILKAGGAPISVFSNCPALENWR